MAPKYAEDPPFPMFKAGFALMAIVAALAIASTLVGTGDEAADTDAQAPTEPTGETAALAGEAGVRTSLLEHWQELGPVLERVTSSREARDLTALEAVHSELIAHIERVPEPGAGSTAAERELHLAYSSAMNMYEDAVDDLVNGVRDDDPVEWSEGIRELRIADGQMEVLLRRMGGGGE